MGTHTQQHRVKKKQQLLNSYGNQSSNTELLFSGGKCQDCTGGCSKISEGVGGPALAVVGMNRNYHVINLNVFLTKSISPTLAMY